MPEDRREAVMKALGLTRADVETPIAGPDAAMGRLLEDHGTASCLAAMARQLRAREG